MDLKISTVELMTTTPEQTGTKVLTVEQMTTTAEQVSTNMELMEPRTTSNGSDGPEHHQGRSGETTIESTERSYSVLILSEEPHSVVL
ncbi:hypothetical protein ROHU_019457 [Labeo rohita]|uniref:Uncharacterized protein n=1 Tax=Labeo rohita TaxID=84645 RepID=A0A498N5P7_LABRO|nr:hypothetical protein ROHU_019457 [Labeo rohita]